MQLRYFLRHNANRWTNSQQCWKPAREFPGNRWTDERNSRRL